MTPPNASLSMPEGGGGHAGAGVGDPGAVERRLQRPVLPGPTVTAHDGDLEVGRLLLGRTDRPTASNPPPAPDDSRRAAHPWARRRGTPLPRATASTANHSAVFDQYSACTPRPARWSSWAACSPVKTLTSCSGDGPPKITAISGTIGSLASVTSGAVSGRTGRGPGSGGLNGSGPAGRSRTTRRHPGPAWRGPTPPLPPWSATSTGSPGDDPARRARRLVWPTITRSVARPADGPGEGSILLELDADPTRPCPG